jgi:DNA-binding GntR family transcriptional regulator
MKNNRVYDILLERLLDGRYTFGERILVKELAAEINISRQPIMTALSKLSAEGFVRISPQVACEVVSPTRAEIADFFLMFAQMEGLLAELAATRRTDRQLRELKSIQLQMEMRDGPKVGAAEYREINRNFHQVIHNMAHSPVLDERQRNNFNMSDFFINQSVGFEQFMAEAVLEHRTIIAALEICDTSCARYESEAHIAAVSRAVLSGLP